MPSISPAAPRHPLLAIAAVLIFAAAAGCASSSAASKPAEPTGTTGLSMTNVTVYSAKSATAAPLWIAQEKGFFAAQGLNVAIKLGALSGSDLASVLLGGSAQFVVTIPSSAILAAQKGAPLRAVAMTASPEVIDLAINEKAAASAKIPTAGATAAQTLAQLAALKGSHLNLTTGTSDTDPNIALTYLLKKAGVTVGDNADVKITTYASTPLQVAAVRSGKADGISSFPPYTIVPDTMAIHLSSVPPLTEAAGYYMSTSTSMIADHADTVRAMVTAITQASQFVQEDRAAAQAIVVKNLKSIGITDANEDVTLFEDYANNAKAYPTEAAFNATERLLNSVEPVTIKYVTFVNNSFADTAFAKLGLTVPS